MNASIRRLAASAIAAAALVVGVGASSASATSFITTNLGVTAIANNDYILTVTGHIEMSQADAQAACAFAGDPLDVELYGQDSGFTFGDDLLITKSAWAVATMSCTTNSTGMNFSVSLTRDGDDLNEDRPGQDELYAYVYFLDIRTGTSHVDASPVVLRNF